MLNFEYFKILIFFLIAFIFVSILILISLVLNKNVFKTSRFKPVECGSHSFGSGKNKVEINFYIIAILFVIFEVEFIVLIPWLFFLKITYDFSIIIILFFLIILVLGLIFEYCKGVFKLDVTDLNISKNLFYYELDINNWFNFIENSFKDKFKK